LKITKTDISLKELVDIDTTNGSRIREDNIRHNQILMAHIINDGRYQPKIFRFKNLSDIVTAGTGITITESNGVLTINGVSELQDLIDVTFTSLTSGDILSYNGVQWINVPLGGGGGGGDMYKATYDIDNDGVVDQAECVQIIVRNSTGVTLTKGQVVYLSGATGYRPNAVLADASTEATSSKTIGLVSADIANNDDGYVTVSGTMHDLDLSMFADGNRLWLNNVPGGMVATTPPAEPNHAVFIGTVARAHPTQGRIILAIQNGYELDELHGVLVPTPSNNDVLTYESSTSLWKNKSVITALGYTPYNATNPSGYTNNTGTVTSVQLSAGTGISLSGTNPITTSGTVTVTNSAPDQTVTLSAGTGIGVSGTYPSFTVTNNAPDQTVALTAGAGIVTSGTYPNFTIATNGVALNKQSVIDGTAITGTTASTLTASILIPANTVSVGDVIYVKTRVRKTGTAGTLTTRMYINTSSAIGGSLIATSAAAAATTLMFQYSRSLAVKSTTNTESMAGNLNVNADDNTAVTTAVSANNIDWTVAQYLVVAVQNGSTADSSRSSFIQVQINKG
jgi:hypothetical protein